MNGQLDSTPEVLTKALEAMVSWSRTDWNKIHWRQRSCVWVIRGEGNLGIQLSAPNGTPLMPLLMVMSLGVLLDASLLGEAQVTNTAQSAFYGLWLVKQLLPYLSPHKLATVIHTAVTSRMVYCDMLYSRLPLRLPGNFSWCKNAVTCVLPGALWWTPTQPKLHQLQ